jgi:hypothetical protein
MHSQLHSQTIAALRAEISAVTTLQTAFNRIALSVDENALAVWDGPRPEDADEVAADDGSFSREQVAELRGKAGLALANRYKEVERVSAGRAALESLLRATLNTGSGGVVMHEGPPPSDVLNALVKSGALRLDWAQDALNGVRVVMESRLEAGPTAPVAPPKKTVAKKPAPKKVKAAPKKAAAKKAPAKKKVVAKAKAAPKKVAAKKSAPKKKPAVKKK